MNAKTIIFDFDGTLADTLNSIAILYNKIAPKYGCKQVTPQDIEQLRNKTPKQVIRELSIPTLKIPTMIFKVKTALIKHFDSIKIHPGIINVLNVLKEKYSLGILTSNSQKNVKTYLKKYNLLNLFDFIYTGKNIFGKDRTIKRLLREQNLTKDEVVYVADETRDIEASHKVGVPIIAVSWGFNKKEILASFNPTSLIDHPDQLLTILT